MLLEEGGLQQLEMVRAHLDTHGDVRRLAESILDSLERHRARTGQPVPQPPPRGHWHQDTRRGELGGAQLGCSQAPALVARLPQTADWMFAYLVG